MVATGPCATFFSGAGKGRVGKWINRPANRSYTQVLSCIHAQVMSAKVCQPLLIVARQE
jgi:hypothetical protein